MGIPRKQKPSPDEREFLFQLDPEPWEECITAYAGIPLVVRSVRSLDVPGLVKQQLRGKQRDRGLDEAGYVESFLVLTGKLVTHARRTWLRVRRLRDQLAEWIGALAFLPMPVRT